MVCFLIAFVNLKFHCESTGSTPVCEDIGRSHLLFHIVYKLMCFMDHRQMLTYGRRIPLPELDYRIEVMRVLNGGI